MFKELGRHMEEIKWPKLNYYTKKPVMYMVKKKKSWMKLMAYQTSQKKRLNLSITVEATNEIEKVNFKNEL